MEQNAEDSTLDSGAVYGENAEAERLLERALKRSRFWRTLKRSDFWRETSPGEYSSEGSINL